MTSDRNAVLISVTAQFCIVLALSLLLIPLKWLIGWILASAVHEFGHYIALRVCRCKVYGICIDINGAVMTTGPMTPGAELFCSISGPLLGTGLLLISKLCPVLGVCAFVQTVFNLLPVYPMDGGRVLRSALLLMLPEKIAIYFFRVVSIVFYGIALVWFSVICIKLSMVMLPILVFAVTAFKYNRVKSSCKGSVFAVQ